MKKYLVILLLFTLIFTVVACQNQKSGYDSKKDTQIIKLLNEGQIDLAKLKVKELYNGQQSIINEWMESISKYNTTPTTNNSTVDKEILVIQDGWEWIKDGDYTYVRGRVKNTGDKDIRYFEVTAEYRDVLGNVLNSEYTNSGLLLKSGNQEEFEIMHKYDEQYAEVRIFVNEVKTE